MWMLVAGGGRSEERLCLGVENEAEKSCGLEEFVEDVNLFQDSVGGDASSSV